MTGESNIAGRRVVADAAVIGRAQPSAEELAAIIAAIELSWPTARSRSPADDEDRSMWRFSGRRWLYQPGPARRLRPYSR